MIIWLNTRELQVVVEVDQMEDFQNELDLDVLPRQRLEIGDIRDLTEADFAEMQLAPVAQPQTGKKLTQRHHALARLIAQGVEGPIAAAATGYAPSTVSILRADPSFKNLVTFYSGEIDDEFRGMHEQLAALSTEAVEALRDRLENDPDAMSVKELQEIIALGADRTGFGPASSQNVKLEIGIADRLANARRRTEKMRTINGTSKEVPLLPGGSGPPLAAVNDKGD